MKIIQRFVTVFILVSSMLFLSCVYGLDQFLYRANEANSRSPSVVDLQDKAPDIGSDTKFSVVVFTDAHFGRNSKIEGTRKDTEFLAWLAAKKTELEAAGAPVRFCVCLGDCVETGAKDEYVKYKALCDTIQTNLSLTVYTVAGNHDLFNSGWNNWSSIVYPYVSSYSFVTTQGDKKMSWYFLDTGNGTLGYRQLTDVVSKMNSDSNPKIVLTHYPVYAGGIFYFTLQNETERDTLLSAFTRDNVELVLEGHYHKGGSFQYGNRFFECVLKSYLDYSSVGVITVDLASQSASIAEFGF